MSVLYLECPAERLPELYALRATVWLAEGAYPGAFPKGTWSDHHDSFRRHWIVLNDDGRVVAGASLAIYEHLRQIDEPEAYEKYALATEGPVAAPARVVVHPANRASGIAQRLLDVQDDAARAAGATLAVRQASPVMRRLLERRGWHHHGPGPEDPRFPRTEFSVMSLNLRGA